MMRRLVLSAAALSPGVASISIQEMTLALALMVLGVSGLFTVAAVTMVASPKISHALTVYDVPDTHHPSLLVATAFEFLNRYSPDPSEIRATLHSRYFSDASQSDVLTQETQIAAVLWQVMSHWQTTEVRRLTDDQARELWLIDRVMRASPAEAGALAIHFAAPNAVLTMRDQIANAKATQLVKVPAIG